MSKHTQPEATPFHSGFVVLVGRSNVGKSTLLNTLIGTKIASTSFRPQLTRNIIHGVMNTPDGQAVFVDTPGVFKDKKSALTKKLTQKVTQALEGVDLVIYVVDPTREIGDEERAVYGMIRHLDIPKLMVINKSDLHYTDREFQRDYEYWGPDFDAVYHLSALKNSHVQPLRDKVIELLPEGGELYLDNQITNITPQFWTAEIIREKVFSVLDKELPYSIAVEVDSMEEKDGMQVITARILTDAERYKKMIIGTKGYKIKEIGQMARKELEQALGTSVYLDLEVEVDNHWVERV
jgi:GTP-binding protein Era